MSTWSNEILLHRQPVSSRSQKFRMLRERRIFARDFWCAECGTLEPVFVIKFSKQEWRAYNFDTELRINSLSKINDAAEKAEGWGKVGKNVGVGKMMSWGGESVKRVKWDSGWLLGVKCQKVEVKHSLSRSSDLVSTNEAGECEGECLAPGRGGIFKDSLHLAEMFCVISAMLMICVC